MPEHTELKKCISKARHLQDYADLSPNELRKIEEIAEVHPLRITPYYLSLINWKDPEDPIRKMAIPSDEEMNMEGFYDTSGEANNTRLHGLQHKYSETALLLVTNRCAMYCRHCFRKRLVGLRTEELLRHFEEAVEYIAGHEEINNVLISGGDPLVLKSEIIEQLLEKLTKINHVDFIRIGSRVPVTLPGRVSDKKLQAILRKYSKSGKRLHVVTHFNHPREITPQSTQAVNNLLSAGVLVDNQTVLLRGVNDNPQVLATLLNRLVGIGVAPYYVFQCRPVSRVKHHFQVPICEGVRIVEEAKARCNGLSKRFKYVMSHETGKIEILGIIDGEVYFKYHEARDRENLGVMFKRHVDEKAGWLDDFKDAEWQHVIRDEMTLAVEDTC